MTLLEKEDKKNNIYSDEEKISKNKDFTQIYDSSSDLLIQLIDIDPLASKIFIFMCKEMNKNNTIIIDIETLSKVFNKTERSIKRSIKTLKENDFLVIIKYQRNNVYLLNPHICCCTQAKHKRKLIKEYDKLSTEKDKIKIDKKIINSEEYDKKNKLTFQINFYKNHEELNPPTIIEEIDYFEELEKQEDINNYEYLKRLGLRGTHKEQQNIEEIEQSNKKIAEMEKQNELYSFKKSCCILENDSNKIQQEKIEKKLKEYSYLDQILLKNKFYEDFQYLENNPFELIDNPFGL